MRHRLQGIGWKLIGMDRCGTVQDRLEANRNGQMRSRSQGIGWKPMPRRFYASADFAKMATHFPGAVSRAF